MADLTGRALDVAIARQLFGWKHFKFSSGLVLFLPPSAAADECITSRNPEEVERGGENDAPPFSTSHDAVAAVRAEIERRGLQLEFVLNLNQIMGARWDPLIADIQWNTLNATPELQCQAALKAVEAVR